MSARGARSRKAVAKDIEKKEKKAAVKNKAAETIRRPNDALADWSPAPNSGTRDGPPVSNRTIISSDASRATSRSSSTHDSGSRPRLQTIRSSETSDGKGLHRSHTSASDSKSLSDISSKGKEKSKYQTKGKETKAPRGRGGGVPVKKPTTTSPPLLQFRVESAANGSYSPTTQKTWINFRIWEGGETGMRPYGGFDYDEDLRNGSVLVYFKEEQVSEDRPVPQIRCDLDVLENSGSTWLSNALLYGRIDENDDDWTLPMSPESSGPSHTFAQNNFYSGQRRMLSPTSTGARSPPPFNLDQAYFGVPGNGTAPSAQYYAEYDRPGGSHSPPPFRQTSQQNPTHELWFTAPAHVKTPQGQRLHHVAVRNFLAMLHDKPIVGADLYEMLNTLQPEIQVMYDLDHDHHSTMSPRERSVQMITNYLSEHKLDDVRNSIKHALCLLAWAEQDNVKWRQGYLESFVHLAGIMTPQIEELPEFKRLSIVTRRNLGIAAKSLQLHIMEAEEKLSTFDFNDLWEDSGKFIGSPVHQSYQAFRQFLTNYYTKIYGNWPPAQGKSWLSRKVVVGLQEDFGALYDYLVNRDVIWDSSEERPGRKWEMVNRKTEEFKADLPELNLTDMLVTYDRRHGYSHIPHPYPLLPREIPQAKAAKEKKGLFSGLKKSKTDTTKDAKAHLQLSIIFSDATNIDKMDVSFNGSTLIDAFERFELAADLKTTTPREARLGRWVLLYGTLQVLSTLSVDVQSLKHTTGVRYFLCTDLRRCPEWVTKGQVELLEASQRRSWCWQRSWDPTPILGAPVELEGSSIPIGEELDSANSADSGTLDGATMLNQDIRRIGEKIDNMGLEHSRNRTLQQEYERKRENEKVMQEEFGRSKRGDDTHRLTESDYAERPLVPNRSPLRSPIVSPNGYSASPQQFPMPPTSGRQGMASRAGYSEERNAWN